ncbi:MAG: hypothetical protein KGH60_01140 [Candidatus Micrarchaeota archaeon]|nr:hypothetical protein [Candidatus Micrarchaeota archaeon]
MPDLHICGCLNRLATIAIIISALAVALPSSFAANGYGTSSISTNPSSVSVSEGHSATVNYTVALASGNTWGTTLYVANENQLNSSGILTSISKPSGDPPYSGTLTITASLAQPSATPGTYHVILAATGDDPSSSNSTVMLTVTAPTTTTVPASGSGSNTTATTTPTTSVPATVATTSINYYSGGGTSGSTPYGLGNYTMLIISIVIIVIIGGIFMAMMKPMPTKLIILGVILILIGIAVWLYGDYNGGLMSYIWGGVGLIVVGTIVWLAGDAIAGAFIRRK